VPIKENPCNHCLARAHTPARHPARAGRDHNPIRHDAVGHGERGRHTPDRGIKQAPLEYSRPLVADTALAVTPKPPHGWRLLVMYCMEEVQRRAQCNRAPILDDWITLKSNHGFFAQFRPDVILETCQKTTCSVLFAVCLLPWVRKSKGLRLDGGTLEVGILARTMWFDAMRIL
jgi:hypothetical protein